MATETRVNDFFAKQLVNIFFKGNLNFIIEPSHVEFMNWEWQEAFLKETLNSDLLKKYPISSQFTTLFLKKIIQHLEGRQEVHDDFYSNLCIAMNSLNKDGFSYRHYLIGNDLNNTITLKETRSMVVNGTTGLKTWEAALMLSDWALANKDIFMNKNVLELGSGVGFTGITISRHCNIKSFVFTDCHTDVLKTICENIQINFPNSSKYESSMTMYKDENKCIGVMELDWNSIEDLPDNLIPNILIGADIVYDPSILHPLCNVIKQFCIKNNELEVYIASVIRNEETFNGFLAKLGDMQLDFQKIELLQNNFIEWDVNIQNCLLKIKTRI